MNPLAGRIVVHADGGELASKSAEAFVALALTAVAERGHFAAALTGGSSPRELYRLLGEERFAGRIPWREVHLFWGDDRVVPPGHPRSNFGLARRLFLDRIPIPAGNLHRVRGELAPARSVCEYAAELRAFFGADASFDLVHLGIGGDGHVASLFPFDRAALFEREAPATLSLFREIGEWRVTLTYPILNSARRVELLVPSASKAASVRAAMYGPVDPVRIPAQGVVPRPGELVWRLTGEVAREGRIAPPAQTSR
jgi:6-phosphogluconolactonase